MTSILYSFRRCPYAMRARMALHVADIQVELREVVLRDKPAELLKISPKGTVPVLQTGDQIIDESLDIMQYALQQNDPEHCLKDYDDDLIQQNDTVFKQNLDRYKYPTRFENADPDQAFDNALIILKDYNNRLKTQAGLAANRQTLTDYAIFPFIRQFYHTDKARLESCGVGVLLNWLNNHLNSTLFKAIMQKHEVWKA